MAAPAVRIEFRLSEILFGKTGFFDVGTGWRWHPSGRVPAEPNSGQVGVGDKLLPPTTRTSEHSAEIPRHATTHMVR